MNATQILARKRDGETLGDDEIAFMVDGYVRGEVPDYQMSALAMAIYLRGMNADETTALTRCMLESGETLVWPQSTSDRRPVVDKHSTGGIGDKVSLVLAPLLACCGVRVPMISGRGLGATGGTLDKLEAIPGFQTQLDSERLTRQVDEVGCAIAGASERIAPADRKLYALRDVTATVGSIPLITASILAKKLAERLDALVLDVKVGCGAFMKTQAQASELAHSLVSTGRNLGVATTALLTDMNQPLGRMIGNALEVDEAVDVLEGGGPEDVITLCLELGAEVLCASGVFPSTELARSRLGELLRSGEARERFERMVRAQGGDLEAPRELAKSWSADATQSGVVRAIDTERLGWLVIDLGGGRRRLGDAIDHAVGFEVHVRLGQTVQQGEPLATVYARPGQKERIAASLLAAFEFSEENDAARIHPLIRDRCRE